MWIQYSRFVFEDARGVVRSTAGCSLFDRFTFLDCCTEIRSSLERAAVKDESIQAEYLFEANKQFQFSVVTALKLNAIDLSWVTWPMVESMLFYRVEGEQVKEGWLIELNRVRPREQGKAIDWDKDRSVLSDLIAGFSHATNSIESAIELTKQYPTDLLLDILEARAEQLRPPETDITKTKKFKAAKKKLEAELKESIKTGKNNPFAALSSISIDTLPPVVPQE